MDEDTAIQILRQIEIDEKGKGYVIHQKFDSLIGDFLRANGFNKLADTYENPCSVQFGYEKK